MEITALGQAGLFIETRHGSILCDPWFNSAYFASWFPFPSNEDIDISRIARPTYLYLSHLHQDHFDPTFLRDHVSKEAVVLLPDFPLGLLERELRALGFTRFIRTTNGEAVERDGLTFVIMALTSPLDGALGDSGLLVDDGTVRVFNQNDAKLRDLRPLKAFGPVAAHFVQFSGASWYPMVYQYPPRTREALGRKKRENGMARALRYVDQLDASFVIPSAGPPCFLDDELFHLNDFDRDPTNTFPDHEVFLDYLRDHGRGNGHLMVPGSTATIDDGSCEIRHPRPDWEIKEIFSQKRAYLEAYQTRQRAGIEAAKKAWPRHRVDILAELREWFEPLLQQADRICAGVDGVVLVDWTDGAAAIDFRRRRVDAWNGTDEWDHRFSIDRSLIESCIVRRAEDWANEIFLSCRFQAWRRGPYNEFVQCFFQSLSGERIQYAEAFFAAQVAEDELWECGGYRIQRRCPHLKADLSRFSKVENGVLTCTLHGWQFDLATGHCLTIEGRDLYTEPINGARLPEGGVAPRTVTEPMPEPPCLHAMGAPMDRSTAAD